MSWADILRDFARHCGWTPDDVLFGQSLSQFLAVWCQPGGGRGEHDPSALRSQINKRRAAKGLPPVKPAPKPKR